MIFAKSLQKIDYANPQDALKKMVNHIRYIQEQLEYTLSNLDSSNIAEIDTDETIITDSSGMVNIGSYLHLTGNNGESLSVGKNSAGNFVFTLNGKNGIQTMYLDSSGELIITKHANLTIDGGEW